MIYKSYYMAFGCDKKRVCGYNKYMKNIDIWIEDPMDVGDGCLL